MTAVTSIFAVDCVCSMYQLRMEDATWQKRKNEL